MPRRYAYTCITQKVLKIENCKERYVLYKFLVNITNYYKNIQNCIVVCIKTSFSLSEIFHVK